MIPQTYVRFANPISLDLRFRIEGEEHEPEISEFTELPLVLHLDPLQRTISAHLPPVPGALLLYGPADFIAACPDTPEDYAARVLQILGSDPADSLQRLIHGEDLPLPPRIPREIPNWRAKAVISTMGLTNQVNAIIEALPEPQKTIVSAAWNGDAKLARKGPTVLGLAQALGMDSQAIDELFIAAESLEV